MRWRNFKDGGRRGSEVHVKRDPLFISFNHHDIATYGCSVHALFRRHELWRYTCAASAVLLDGAAQKLYLAGAAAFLATLAASLSASSISFIISRFSDMLSYAMYFLPARSYTHGTREGGSAAV